MAANSLFDWAARLVAMAVLTLERLPLSGT